MSYRKLSEGFLKEAKQALARYKQTKDEVELRQACDKGFGAFAQALMYHKGFELHHRDFGDAVDELFIKTGNRDIPRAHTYAEALHASFYERRLSLSEIEDALTQIEMGIQAVTELK